MTRLHPLDTAAVLDAACALFDGLGYATTLDAKRWLRARGYYATQAEVSAHMDALHETEGWTREEAEVYHVDGVPAGAAALRPVGPFYLYRPAGVWPDLADAIGDLVRVTVRSVR